MATNPIAQGYWYEVKAYEFINDNLGGGTSNVEAPSVNADGWALIDAVNNKAVNVKSKVKYEVRVYKGGAAGQTTLGSTAPDGILGDDDGVRVVVFESYRNKISGFATISGVKQTAAVSGKGNTVFYFNVDSTAPGSVTPQIQVTLLYGSQANNPSQNPSFSLDNMDVAIKSGTSMPTVTFTKAIVPPSIPKGLKDLVGSERARWNPCLNKWVGMLIEQKTNPSTKKLANSVSLVYCEKDGTNFSQTFLGWDTLTSGPNFGKAQEELLKAVRADCTTIDSAPAAVVTPVAPSDGLIKYNPPSHFVTRGVSHGNRVTVDQQVDIKGIDSKGNTIIIGQGTRSYSKALDQALYISSRNRLGRIYQSQDGALALNQRGGGPKGKGKLNYWGFRFTYNPNKLSYGTTTNTSIDWMLNSMDPANLLGGNTTVEIELYLNRIADLTELKKWRSGNYANNYPTPLVEDDVKGLLARGTEYDLEFLYRVLNGDPGKTSLLSYPDGETADFGYITGTPCWFHLHDNLRYFGSMSSVNVNHMLFNEAMVPMLSVVTLSFVRYPALEFSPPKVKEKFYEVAKATISSTGKEG